MAAGLHCKLYETAWRLAEVTDRLTIGKAQMTNNYYRCARRYFFFNDTNYDETRAAYSQAQIIATGTGLNICVWRPVKHPGHWDDAAVVGFRSYAWLQKKLVENPEDQQIKAELQQLNNLFSERRM